MGADFPRCPRTRDPEGTAKSLTSQPAIREISRRRPGLITQVLGGRPLGLVQNASQTWMAGLAWRWRGPWARTKGRFQELGQTLPNKQQEKRAREDAAGSTLVSAW